MILKCDVCGAPVESPLRRGWRVTWCEKHKKERRLKQCRDAKKRFVASVHSKASLREYNTKRRVIVIDGFFKRRTCLKCGKDFLSESKANRLCEKCNRANNLLHRNLVY